MYRVSCCCATEGREAASLLKVSADHRFCNYCRIMRAPGAMLLLVALSTSHAWLTPVISHRGSSCLARVPASPSLTLQSEATRATWALKSSGDDNVDGDGVATKKKRVRKVAMPSDAASTEGNVEAVQEKAGECVMMLSFLGYYPSIPCYPSASCRRYIKWLPFLSWGCAVQRCRRCPWW